MPKKAAAKKAARGSSFYGVAVRPRRVPVRKTAAVPVAGKDAAQAKKPKRSNARRKQSFEPGLVFVAMSFRRGNSGEVFSAIKEVCKSTSTEDLRKVIRASLKGMMKASR